MCCFQCWFLLKDNSHIPCRVPAVLRPLLFASDFSKPRHNTAGARYDTCKLTSAVCLRSVGDLPRFGFFDYHAEFHDWQFRFFRLHADFHEGHSTVVAGMCELARHGTTGARQGHGVICVNQTLVCRHSFYCPLHTRNPFNLIHCPSRTIDVIA